MNSKRVFNRLSLLTLLVVLIGSPAWAEPAEKEAKKPQETKVSGDVVSTANKDETAPKTKAKAKAEDDEEEGDEASKVTTVVPAFFHAPPISARAGQPLVLQGLLSGHWRLERLYVEVYGAKGTPLQVDFVRARKTGVMATIPGEWVERGGFAYAIRSIDKEGAERNHFASPENPHPVSLVGFSKAMNQQRQLARFNNHRSQFRVRGNYTAYGSRYPEPVSVGEDPPDDRTTPGTDNLWLTQLEYLYRPLNFLHDFRFGIGVMRGQWPRVNDRPIYDDEAPGINYGYGEVNLEFHRWFSAGGRLILGADAVGFTMGAAGLARIGDLAGTHASAELEVIGNVGSRTDLRFTWTTVPKMPMALGIEFTSWPTPSSSNYTPEGANLYYDIAYQLGAATLGLRLGNAKRAQSLDGGYQGGLNFSYGL